MTPAVVWLAHRVVDGGWGRVGMQREPSLTFEGALRILGQHEHKTIERIDKLLDGVILGGGAVAGAVALGAAPLAPLAVFGVVWGWVEQKGLAVDLLKSAVDAVSGKVTGLRGLEKRELIAAAHSAIVVAAVFESVREHIGKELYENLEITDDEKLSIINRMEPHTRDDSVRLLYAAELPAPSAAIGFEENAVHVAEWQARYVGNLHLFLQGLTVGENALIDLQAICTSAEERYRSRYLELAAKVPEFVIWAQLEEHAATRTAIREVRTKVTGGIAGLGAALREQNADVMVALNANRDGLNRVAALLATGTPGVGGQGERSAAHPHLGDPSGLRARVTLANAGVLDRPIISTDRERFPVGLKVPSVGEIYVNPRYRVAVFDEQARPADERWWEERKSRDDFDVFLARYVTSPDATRRPLLLLGHPGAGKVAADEGVRGAAAQRRSTQWYGCRCGRSARTPRSITRSRKRWRSSTHERIQWSDLAEQSGDTVRVVLLDGLDELLQASEHDRSSYLRRRHGRLPGTGGRAATAGGSGRDLPDRGRRPGAHTGRARPS